MLHTAASPPLSVEPFVKPSTSCFPPRSVSVLFPPPLVPFGLLLLFSDSQLLPHVLPFPKHILLWLFGSLPPALVVLLRHSTVVSFLRLFFSPTLVFFFPFLSFFASSSLFFSCSFLFSPM